MGFWEAVQWWQEWQLRILVLMSLFLRCFLCFARILRKRCIPSWLRFLIWLAYVSSDPVAIYGLFTLFNRPNSKTHESSARLQVLWAPILLIHLGGQNGITAYNIEDNELWRRHVLTAVTQVAVAVYVFRNSWPEDRRILAAGVMLFVIGILKCVLKPWDLKRVSINSLVDSSAGSQGNRDVSSLDEYIRSATGKFRQQSGTAQDNDEGKMWKPYDLFVDLTPPYSDRLCCLKAMVLSSPSKAHGLVRDSLSTTFDRLYTKESLQLHDTTKSLDGCIIFLRYSVILGSFLAVLLEYAKGTMSNFEAYDHIDDMITLLLIGFTIFLDNVYDVHNEDHGQSAKGRRWPDHVAQYNVIGYLARNKNHRKLRRLGTLLVCKDYIDQLWCMKPSKSSRDITRLVHGYIAKGWTEHHIKDTATFRDFNDNRGQWTLSREGCGDSLNWSLERPFDESVLLWHLATDFCFHLTATPPSDETARLCRVMSNYMVYLLFVDPEMLMTGARRFLFREAYRHLKKTLNLILQQPNPDATVIGPSRHENESELACKIAKSMQHASGHHQFRLVYDAWRLAQHLQNLCVEQEQDNGKMWRVIQGVWVEMLCFSAGRCRGYLHAKSLGKGGEYLSYIWLLMAYMGMETLAERMQRPKLKAKDARNNGGSSNGTTATASSSSIATGGSGNGTAAEILVPAAGGGHVDDRTEASTSTPVTEGGDADADGTIPASPVTTTGPGGEGTTAASLVTPSGDDNV